MTSAQWDKCSATTKYGILDGFDASIWADGGQNWLRSNYALNEHAYYDNSGFDGERDIPTVQDLINRLFTYGLDHWGAFSSSRYTSPHPEAPKQDGSAAVTLPKLKLDEKNVKNAMNLEFIHNNIHVSFWAVLASKKMGLTRHIELRGRNPIPSPRQRTHSALGCWSYEQCSHGCI